MERRLFRTSDQRGILNQLRALTSFLHLSKTPAQLFTPPHSCPSKMPLERVRRKADPSLDLAFSAGWLSRYLGPWEPVHCVSEYINDFDDFRLTGQPEAT